MVKRVFFYQRTQAQLDRHRLGLHAPGTKQSLHRTFGSRLLTAEATTTDPITTIQIYSNS